MIVTSSQLPAIRNLHSDQKIILALGSFDLLHCGHIEYLTWCKGQGDILVVSINTDQEIMARKGKLRPIIKEQDRLQMIDALKIVNYSVLDNVCDSFIISENLQPNIVVLGSDNAHEVPGWKARLPQISLLIDSQIKAHSTTSIIGTILHKHTRKPSALS